MSVFSALKGRKQDLNNASIADGQLLLTTDTKELYVDTPTQRLSILDKVVRSQMVCLYADNWVGDTAPYTQMVEVAGVTMSSNGFLELSNTMKAIKPQVQRMGIEIMVQSDGGFTMSAQSADVRNQNIDIDVYYWTEEGDVEKPFAFGLDGEEVDANWFAELQNYMLTNTAATISANDDWLGQVKRVTLRSEVLGTTSHLIQCIGVNQDGANTVTFQTKDCLNGTVEFGSSSTWTGSDARTQCINYYNAFPGKKYIKTVKRGTNNSSLVYTDETVFLPSIHEMGLASYTNAPASGEYAYNKQYPYTYYANNASRIKNLGENGSPVHYWTRTKSTTGNSAVCVIEQDGSASYGNYYSVAGIAPAFVIG